MNLIQKIIMTKAALSDANIKKSGKNTFSNYEYFELADFLPTIVQQQAKLNYLTEFTFTSDLATLSIVDADKPDESIVYTVPMSTANLKGNHDIQNLGAVITYLRRYLYVNAFDIVEHDSIDATPRQTRQDAPKTAPPAKVDNSPATAEKVPEPAKITDAQRKALVARLESEEDKARLLDILRGFGYQKSGDIKPEHYDEICKKYDEHGLPFDLG